MAGKQSKEQEQSSSLFAGTRGKIAELREFFEEARAELKKVTWPTTKEAKTTSIAVLILVVVMALFLGIVDLGLTKLVELILSPGV